MPEKLKSLGKPNFSALAPKELRVSSVVEIGAKFRGRLPDLIADTGCESCQKCEGCQSCQQCEGCQSCQTSLTTFGRDLGIDLSGVRPLKIARDVIYEVIQDADAEHGNCDISQSRIILETTQEEFNRIPGKENFTEIGTTKTGEKQYLWRGGSAERP